MITLSVNTCRHRWPLRHPSLLCQLLCCFIQDTMTTKWTTLRTWPQTGLRHHGYSDGWSIPVMEKKHLQVRWALNLHFSVIYLIFFHVLSQDVFGLSLVLLCVRSWRGHPSYDGMYSSWKAYETFDHTCARCSLGPAPAHGQSWPGSQNIIIIKCIIIAI